MFVFRDTALSRPERNQTLATSCKRKARLRDVMEMVLAFSVIG